MLSVIFIVFFIRHEFITEKPLIDLEILRHRPFIAGYLLNIVNAICILGLSSFIPLFVVSVYGLTTIQSGLILSLRSIGTILATIVSSLFLIRWGYRRPLLGERC